MPPKISDEPRTERLTVNITPTLRARLAEAREKSGNTMNGEIHSRLDATLDDPTLRIAAAIWPTIQKLNEDDRKKLADLIVAMSVNTGR